MIDLLVKVLINAIGVFAAVKVVPQIKFDYGNDLWKLLAVALILALINSYLKPIVKALSFPISILTLGAVAFVINAAMLLLVAFVSDQFKLHFTIGGFPPNMTADAFIGALLGSIVISIVSTLLGLVNTGRKIVS